GDMKTRIAKLVLVLSLAASTSVLWVPQLVKATISNTDVRQLYTGNGSNTDFAIPFDFASTSEIKVYVRDTSVTPATETLQTISTDYTLVGGPPVTTVRFNTAPAATDKVL